MAEAEGILYKSMTTSGFRCLVLSQCSRTAKMQSNNREHLPENGWRPCPDKRAKGRGKGPVGRSCPGFLPTQRSCFLRQWRRETQPQLNLRQSRGGNLTPERREGERRYSQVFPCQRWELGRVREQGSRGGREGSLQSTVMPWLRAELGKQPRRVTNAQSSPVNTFYSAHPLVLPLSGSPNLPPS